MAWELSPAACPLNFEGIDFSPSGANGIIACSEAGAFLAHGGKRQAARQGSRDLSTSAPAQPTGFLRHTSDGGRTFTTSLEINHTIVDEIQFAGESIVGVFDGETIHVSHDGGAAPWTPVAVPLPPGVASFGYLLPLGQWRLVECCLSCLS